MNRDEFDHDKKYMVAAVTKYWGDHSGVTREMALTDLADRVYDHVVGKWQGPLGELNQSMLLKAVVSTFDDLVTSVSEVAQPGTGELECAVCHYKSGHHEPSCVVRRAMLALKSLTGADYGS